MKDKINDYKGYAIITNLRTKEQIKYDNIVCKGFYNMIANFMVGVSPAKIGYLAIGDDATAVTEDDTTLGNETNRVAISTVLITEDQMKIQTLIDGGTAVYTWKELGLFNDATVGTMTNHINVNYNHIAGDPVTIDWYIERA